MALRPNLAPSKAHETPRFVVTRRFGGGARMAAAFVDRIEGWSVPRSVPLKKPDCPSSWLRQASFCDCAIGEPSASRRA